MTGQAKTRINALCISTISSAICYYAAVTAGDFDCFSLGLQGARDELAAFPGAFSEFLVSDQVAGGPAQVLQRPLCIVA